MPRRRLNDVDDEVIVQEEENYFLKKEKSVEFIPTGCTLLNMVIGGGWPMARIVNIAGDEATGKCVNDAYLLTEGGLVCIDDEGADKCVGTTHYGKRLALGENKSVIATHFYKQEVEQTRKFVTKHGFELNATDKHRVIVLTKDMDIAERYLSDIKVGDYIVLSPGTELFPTNEVKLNINIKAKVTKHDEIILAGTVNEELAALLGFFVADGTLSSGNLVLTASKRWKRDAIERLSIEALGVNPFYRKGGYHYSNQVKELLPHLFGKKLDGITARFKSVPEVICRSPKHVQAAFLSVLISCDSDITNTNLVYCTASRKLARQVQMMLLNFGVVASLYSKFVKLDYWDESREYFNVAMSGYRYDEFLNKIGLYVEVDKKPSRNGGDYHSIPYVIEYLKNEVTKVRTALGWRRNGKLADGSYFPRTGLFSIRSHRDSISRVELGDFLSLLDGFLPEKEQIKLERFVDCSYIFEEVVKVDDICEMQTVYDVHVPDGNLFWASGFINHNTLLCIEASRNFKKKYPEGIVFYREAEAAFDEDYAEAIGMPVSDVEFLDPDVEFNTVESFYNDIDECIKRCEKEKVPGLYILDSLDALSDEEELGRDFNKGSFGTQKAKNMSKAFRMMTRRAANANMAIIIISQTRDKISTMGIPGKTKSGGKGLNFYASVILWLSHIETMRRTRAGIKRAYAIRVKVRCSKNKISLAHREAEFVITFGQGIDDVQSNNDWLEDTKKDSEVFGVTRKTYDKRIEGMDDKSYWDEADRVAEAVTGIWIEADRLQLQDVRRRRD